MVEPFQIENKRKTVALLGGSFDPPTLAHVQLASEVYNTHENVDEVWIVPCGDGRNDKNLKTKGEHRLNMVNLIIKDIIGENAPILVSDIEVKRSHFFPTYELIKTLKEENPDIDFIFCMGTDLLESFRKWENGEELAENQEFIILRRMGYDPDPKYYPKHFTPVDTIIEGSSTKIRNRIKDQIENRNKINLGITGLTTSSVIKYIVDNHLYAIPEEETFDKINGNLNTSLNLSSRENSKTKFI